MTPSGCTEDALVERPAIALLHELGWETFNAYGEFDHSQSSLERETKAEVVLKSPLRPGVPVNEPVDEPVNERQRWFLTQLHQHRRIKVEHIVQQWGVSLATAKRDIAALRKLNLIEFSGAPKSGAYHLQSSQEARQ